jgi:hypothetical protein
MSNNKAIDRPIDGFVVGSANLIIRYRMDLLTLAPPVTCAVGFHMPILQTGQI